MELYHRTERQNKKGNADFIRFTMPKINNQFIYGKKGKSTPSWFLNIEGAMQWANRLQCKMKHHMMSNAAAQTT